MRPKVMNSGTSPPWRTRPIASRPPSTRLAALKRNEVDIAYSIRGELAAEIQQTQGLTLRPTVGSAPYWAYFPEQWDEKSPWHDLRVRQAVSLAIDRKTINDALTLGYSHLTGSVIPENFEFFWQPPAPVFDLPKAKQLLAEAGYPNGFTLTLAGPNDRYVNDSAIAEAIAQGWTRVGVRTTVDAMPAARGGSARSTA